ncbi:unnamed protein product [Prorocentrum cordatum]|uniref:Uncharacterized protein n=1 Tax=Prorocentrum cordatum TaxID=2364126 RepID=A0ABN9PRY5_9DINO|nr:unnamed protein product [Polarella glacialis]
MGAGGSAEEAPAEQPARSEQAQPLERIPRGRRHVHVFLEAIQSESAGHSAFHFARGGALGEAPLALPLPPPAHQRAPGHRGAALPAEELARSREEFARLWELHVPWQRVGADAREALQRVGREWARTLPPGAEGSAGGAAEVEAAIGSALASVPAALTVEEAFAAFCAAFAGSSPPPRPSGTPGGAPLRLEFGAASPHAAVSHGAPALPKGARMVDPVPVREMGWMALGCDLEGASRGGAAAAAEAASPMRPTRAALESANAHLQGALCAATAAYDRLVLRAEAIRAQLERGSPSSGPAGDAAEGLALARRGLSMQRVRAVSLQSELDRCLDRARFGAGVAERQRAEIAALRADCASQAQRAAEALRRRDEAQGKLQRELQEREDLSRKAKTEQLRAAMLREAFEQEQTRVGVSLGRAEAFVCDLVAATEGTRRMEVEEQSVARECSSALSEIQAAQAQDSARLEARHAQLEGEMDEARRALQRARQGVGGESAGSAQAVRATVAYAMIESQRHDVITELDEARRRYREAATTARLRAIDASGLRHKLTVLRSRSDRLVDELAAAKGRLPSADASGEAAADEGHRRGGRSLWETSEAEAAAATQARLCLAEAAAAAADTACAEIAQQLARERAGVAPGPELPRAGSAEVAARQSVALAAELRRVREELSQATASAARHQRGQADDLADLEVVPPVRSRACPPSPRAREAAGLQRRIGAALAGEQANLCRLQEERLRGPA